jgi:hypothetical protein
LLYPASGVIGNFVIFHDTKTCWNSTNGAQLKHGAEIRGVRLDVIVGTANSLPNAVEIRVTIGSSGNIRVLGKSAGRQANHQYDSAC